jgi:hypothetical protein
MILNEYTDYAERGIPERRRGPAPIISRATSASTMCLYYGKTGGFSTFPSMVSLLFFYKEVILYAKKPLKLFFFQPRIKCSTILGGYFGISKRSIHL